jgi:hypothetical protein
MASTITSPLNKTDPVLPTLKISIPKNDITKDLAYEETEFTVTPYAESSIPVNVASGFIEIPQSFVTPVKKIFVIAPSDPGGVLPVATTVRLFIDDGVNPTSNIDLPMQNIMLYCPSPSMATRIKKVYIANSSIPTVNVQVRIYG